MSSVDNILSLEVVTQLLSDIVLKENVIDPVYEISSGSAKGDGYASVMTRVIVRGKNKVLPLIIKKALGNSQLRESIPIRVAFLQEIKYYEEIIPAFKEFQKERGVQEPFNSVPVCYKTVDSDNGELLIMENIKEKGFRLFDKSKQMDQAHVEMVLRTYGHFHAISYCMKDHDMDRFEKLTKNLGSTFSHVNQDFYNMLMDGIDKIKSVFDENSEAHLCHSISNLKDKIMPFFNKAVHKYNGQYGVVIHGDCWCNNMMFKYHDENSTSPTHLHLLDFQSVTLTTPVIDLSYFFYASASQEMLDNMEYYLKIYHDSLRKHMLEMGSDVDKYFPYSALKHEWTQYAQFGLFLSLAVYRVMLRDEDEILDFNDKADMKDAFMNSSKNDHLINERYRRIGLHFYNNKLI